MSEEPSRSFLSLIGAEPEICGPIDDELIIVYTGQGFMAVGTKEAGCICSQGSECISGHCSCKLGVNPSKTRCCHKLSGQTCTVNDDCQSGNCVDGKCLKVECDGGGTTLCDSRPNGSSCRVNDDCQSGKCRVQDDGRYVCVA